MEPSRPQLVDRACRPLPAMSMADEFLEQLQAQVCNEARSRLCQLHNTCISRCLPTPNYCLRCSLARQSERLLKMYIGRSLTYRRWRRP